MTRPFEPSRPDGRSDRQVVYDLTADAEPGELFYYAGLVDALAEGLDEAPDVRRVYPAVAAANKTLLRERKRYLGVVRGVGYRMLRADEHLGQAIVRKDRATGHLHRGREILRGTLLDELTTAQRALHQGQLMILSALCEAMDQSEKRHARAESLIEDIKKDNRRMEERIDRLERDIT